jgi:hypothetical protein
MRLLAATGAGMVTVTRRICCEVAGLHLTVILVLRLQKKISFSTRATLSPRVLNIASRQGID